ncbi:MAG: hypothetical protein HY840_13075 [Bacteroidetes bacterium]|nr:hypothetical protein [Bacteroidota bacterium]
MNQRLMSAQNMMLDKVISADDYRGIKENLNTELNRLSREHLQLSFMETDYKKYVSFGRNIMQHLSEIYTKASIIAKQRIIGLTFPEKLKFVKEECRTFGAARVVSLICPLFKELQGQKKGSHDNFYHDSRWVDPLGLEPRLY